MFQINYKFTASWEIDELSEKCSNLYTYFPFLKAATRVRPPSGASAVYMCVLLSNKFIYSIWHRALKEEDGFTFNGLLILSTFPSPIDVITSALLWLFEIWKHCRLKRHRTCDFPPSVNRMQWEYPWSITGQRSRTQPWLHSVTTAIWKTRSVQDGGVGSQNTSKRVASVYVSRKRKLPAFCTWRVAVETMRSGES